MSGLCRAMSVGETAAAWPVLRKTVRETPTAGLLLFFVWTENEVPGTCEYIGAPPVGWVLVPVSASISPTVAN